MISNTGVQLTREDIKDNTISTLVLLKILREQYIVMSRNCKCDKSNSTSHETN